MGLEKYQLDGKMNYKFLSTLLISLGVFLITQPLTQLNARQDNKPIIENANEVKPKRLTINISVDSPDDVKISEGVKLRKGQIIATRDKLKTRLFNELENAKTSKDKLINLKPLPPNLPQEIPPLSVLPPISYLEFEADIEKNKTAIAFIEDEINSKNEEIKYLSSLPNLEEEVIKHEQAKLKKLKQKLITKTKEYQLSQGKFETAKNQRKYQEYQAQLNKTRRIENINQQRLDYDRQLAIYKKELIDHEINLKTLDKEINELTNAIANSTNSISPYSGTVRRIKFINQSSDGIINAEISLLVN